LEKPISEYFTINNKKNKKVYYRNLCKHCYCRRKSVGHVEKKISIPIEIEISKPIKIKTPKPIIEIKIPIEKVEIFKPIKKIQFKSVILTASLQKMMAKRRQSVID